MNLEKNLKCIQLIEHVSVTALHCGTFPLKSTPETLYVVKASYATSQNLHATCKICTYHAFQTFSMI